LKRSKHNFRKTHWFPFFSPSVSK